MTNWCVYILECNDAIRSLYVGITNDLEKRLKKHNSGKGAKYTRGRTPVKLIKSFAVNNKSEALKLEYFIKRLPRSKKLTYSV